MLKYIQTDLETVVHYYIENVIRECIPDADAETFLIVKQDKIIQSFIDGVIDSIRSSIYGNKNSLH